MSIDLMLDTSALIYMIRNRPSTRKILIECKGEVYTCFVCMAELYDGVFGASDIKDAEKKLLSVLEKVTKIIDIDKYVAKEFGKIKHSLRRKNKIIDDIDILIGATARLHNCAVVTTNVRHFERIEGLDVIGV